MKVVVEEVYMRFVIEAIKEKEVGFKNVIHDNFDKDTKKSLMWK